MAFHKRFLLICFFLLFASAGHASDSSLVNSKYIKSIKVNYNSNYFLDFYRYNPYVPPQKIYLYPNFNLANIGIGLVWRNRKNYNSNELELSDVSFGNFHYKVNRGLGEDISGNYQQLFLRYQYNYFFLKRPSHLSPYLGASVLGGFSRFKQNIDYSSGTSYKSRELKITTQYALVPGLRYNVSNRVYLDFSIPITLMRFSSINNKSKNSNYPLYILNFQSLDFFSFFKKDYLMARLGVGVNLNSDDNEKVKSKEKYIKTVKMDFDIPINKGSSIKGPIPVLTFQNKKNFMMHEVELWPITYRKNTFYNASVSELLNLNSKYLLKYFFIHKSKTLLSPYAGVSFAFSYTDYKYSDKNNLFAAHSWQYLRFDNSFIPGVQIHTGERLYMDISCPLIYLSSGKQNMQSADPTLNPTGTYNWVSFFPKPSVLNFKFGLGWKL